MSHTMALFGLTLAVLAVLGLHMLMARKGPVWLGAVMPSLFVIAVVVLIVQGQLEPGRPYVVSLAALVMLLWMWVSAREAKSKVEAKEPGGSMSRGS